MISCAPRLPAGRLLVLVVLIPALAGCTGDAGAPSAERVTIGLVASLTGAYEAVGQDTRDGFELYLHSHGGRLGGHLVDLVVVDEGDGGPEAIAAANRLIGRDGLLATTGVTA